MLKHSLARHALTAVSTFSGLILAAQLQNNVDGALSSQFSTVHLQTVFTRRALRRGETQQNTHEQLGSMTNGQENQA